jgi:hypothetical protein
VAALRVVIYASTLAAFSFEWAARPLVFNRADLMATQPSDEEVTIAQ